MRADDRGQRQGQATPLAERMEPRAQHAAAARLRGGPHAGAAGLPAEDRRQLALSRARRSEPSHRARLINPTTRYEGTVDATMTASDFDSDETELGACN